MSRPSWRSRLPPILPTATRTVQILAFVHLFNSYVAEIRSCFGFSMLPTLSHTGDFVVVSPLAYTRLFSSTRRPVRGDLVFATSPTDPRTTLCKRVVGLEGDIVEVEPRRPVERVDEAEKRSGNRHGIKSWGDGMETGYGAEVEEIHGQHGQEAIVRNDDHGMPPLPAPTWSRRKEGQFVRVPKGHVWLAGDNMSNSTDSRMYGPVPLALIKGKVIGRIYPHPRLFGNGTKEIITPQATR